MKQEKNILIAFLLNLFFSVFELIGGAITGSVAIMSDALHDFADAVSIGVSYFLERKSSKKPDKTYTYGYIRYSVIAGLLTTVILLAGSVVVIYNAVLRLCNPIPIDYNGMIIFAVIGVAVNFLAAYFTREGDSINERAVNLHMLEDVLGWAVVLVGAVVMRLVQFPAIDPLLSIGVAAFILVNALKNLKEVLNLFLEKTPADVDIDSLAEHLTGIPGVENVHHMHIWSLDGIRHCATMHIVTSGDSLQVKNAVKQELQEHGIFHITIEIETPGEKCSARSCEIHTEPMADHNHHHHHHH